MIKRLQLRGISRTPSDRMTDDGGCAESLNVFSDNQETAPCIIPDDISESVNLPKKVQIKNFYIHHTSAYEHYIIYAGGVLKFGEKVEDGTYRWKDIQGTTSGIGIKDITSVGNTIILFTDKGMMYLLFKNGTYKILGPSLPIPDIEVTSTDRNESASDNFLQVPLSDSMISGQFSDEKRTELQNKIQSDILPFIKARYNKADNKSMLAPRFLRYTLRLYDGTFIHQSVPIYLGAGHDYSYFLNVTEQKSNKESKLNFIWHGMYSSYLSLKNKDTFKDWEDIIESVDIFLSREMINPMLNNDTKVDSYRSYKEDATKKSAELKIEGAYYTREEMEEFATSKENSVFYKYDSYYLVKRSNKKTLDDLVADPSLKPLGERVEMIRDDELLLREQLTDDFQSNNTIIADHAFKYNNRLNLYGISQVLTSGYRYLNATFLDKEKKDRALKDVYVEMKFFIGSRPFDVLGKYTDGTFTYKTRKQTDDNLNTWWEQAYGWIVYPDQRCTHVKMHIYETDATNGLVLNDINVRVPMKPHPSLACSYAYLGFGRSIKDLQDDPSVEVDTTTQNNVEKIGNKIFQSEVNNPFIYPLELRYTISDGDVVRMTTTTKALSEGQFGQFPVYVFTSEGIWTMNTTSIGTFSNIIPLSREVCNSYECVAPIDQSIIFATRRGVKILDGSNVSDLSKGMNGRHYCIESTAERMIMNEYGFCNYTDILEDTTPFMEFINKVSSVAYDYEGRRLVFIKKDEKYQYIYKLDSNTWHKMSMGGIMMQYNVNSYPECLAIGDLDFVGINNEPTGTPDEIFEVLKKYYPDITKEEMDMWLSSAINLPIVGWSDVKYERFVVDMKEVGAEVRKVIISHLYNLSTILDSSKKQMTLKGIIATRPFDLGETDVLKSIKDVRIRGQFQRGAVRFILLGSMDGFNFNVVNTLRGKAWKVFRLIILADLTQFERISWVDIEYETRFNTKLR